MGKHEQTKSQQIADLESEVRELRDFHKKNRDLIAAYEESFRLIWNEHPPFVVKSRSGIGFEIRCRRCQTDEHHTWANDNYLPWPCPTLAPMIANPQAPADAEVAQ